MTININNVGTILEKMLETRNDEIEHELRHDKTINYEHNIIKARTLDDYLRGVIGKDYYKYYEQIEELEHENFSMLTNKTYIQGFKDGLSLLIYAIAGEKVEIYGQKM